MTAAPVVLLVEDDDADVLFFERALRKAGVECTLKVVRDGQRAQDYFAGAGEYADRAAFPLPTYVFLDLKLPRRSGLEVLQWLRAEKRFGSIPVVVLTSSRESSDVGRAMDLGAKAYCVKPLATTDLALLIGGVHAWLTRGRPLPEEFVHAHFLGSPRALQELMGRS